MGALKLFSERPLAAAPPKAGNVGGIAPAGQAGWAFAQLRVIHTNNLWDAFWNPVA